MGIFILCIVLMKKGASHLLNEWPKKAWIASISVGVKDEYDFVAVEESVQSPLISLMGTLMRN